MLIVGVLFRGSRARVGSSLEEVDSFGFERVSERGVEIQVHFEEEGKEVVALLLQVDQTGGLSVGAEEVQRPSLSLFSSTSTQQRVSADLRGFLRGPGFGLIDEEVLALLDVHESLILLVDEGAVDFVFLKLELLHGLLTEVVVGSSTRLVHV